MRIIDDFLDTEYHQHLQTVLMGWEFPWYYQHTLTHGNDDVQAHGFNHWLTSEGDPDFAQLVDTMQSTIKATECLRVRADMTLYNSEGYRHAFHVDCEEPHTVCIYYVNDSDGDTVIYNETEKSDEYTIREVISPKKNRLVFFDGKYYHTGHSPSSHNYRVLLNSDFYKR